MTVETRTHVRAIGRAAVPALSREHRVALLAAVDDCLKVLSTNYDMGAVNKVLDLRNFVNGLPGGGVR